jgi:hypothetical protein
MYSQPIKPLSYSLFYGWYNLSAVNFEMVKFLFNREFALFVAKCVDDPNVLKRSVRNLKVHSVQHLEFNLKATQMFQKETPYNFYYSLARFRNGIPNQTLNFAIRDNTEWNENCYKDIISYDYLIDIDAADFDDLQIAYETAVDLKRVFDKLNVPYELRFSGMGFHFIIPYKYLPQDLTLNPHIDNNLYQFCQKLTGCLNDRYSELIDTSIYDSRRVCKLPYSLALYKNDAFVCSPILSDEELVNFSLYKYRPAEYPFTVERRGIKIFNENGNLSLLLLKFNLNKFIKGLNNVYCDADKKSLFKDLDEDYKDSSDIYSNIEIINGGG